MLDRIIEFFLTRRLFALMLTALILGFGLFSAASISTDAFPDVTGIQVDIVSKYPGKSPLEVEQYITNPVEISMRGLPGLRSMRSVSRFGISVITAVFEDRTDIYFARQQVMERLIEIRDTLPAGVETTLGPVATAMGEIYQYTLEDRRPLSPGTDRQAHLTELRTLQDWVITPYLKNVPGVNEIDPFGGYIKQYLVTVNSEKLTEYGLGLREVFESLSDNNANVGGSFLERGREQYIIRGVGQVESIGDIRNITLKSDAGATVLLDDVADVREGHAIRYGAAVRDGKEEVVGAGVLMLRGCNSRQVVNAVKEKVKEINEGGLLPQGVSISPFYDRSDIVGAASHTLAKALGEGIVLIVIVIWFFLRSLRGAWVIVSALVLSVLASAIALKLTGLTANLMTLGGLIISLGMIIDSAIIQTENVERHLSLLPPDEPADKLSTVLRAVLEVRKPSILGELIIAITFLPILALEGIEGRMFSPLAVSVFIALMVSLVLSILVIPVICFYTLKTHREKVNRPFQLLKDTYLRLLEGALKRPALVIVPALLLFIASLIIIPFLGTEFLPVMDEGAFDMDSILLPGVSLTQSIEINSKIQQIVKRYPELDTVVSKIGWSGLGLDAKDMDSGFTTGRLLPRKLWKNARSQKELTEKMRNDLSKIPGIIVSFSQPIQCRIDEMVAGTKSQIVIRLFGDDVDTLRKKADEIGDAISKVRGVKDLFVEQVAGQHYVNIKTDRKRIARYGMRIRDVNDIIEISLGGKTAGTFYEGNRYFDIVMRFDEKSRNSVEAIGNLLVDVPGSETKLPLKEVANITVDEGPVQISHEAGRRKIMIQCNVYGRDLGSFVGECRKLIREKVILPQGYYIQWGGQFENQEKAFRKLSIIVPITIGIIFLLLFATFESLQMAILITVTLPMALIGGIFALIVSRSYLSVPASIGFIALFGIAVLNGVVLISYITQLKEKGMSIQQAIIEGCVTRLRPVLMTASIAIFSLIPLLLSTGPGSEVQRPLAIVVAGGLFTSTLMSLFVLPVLYRRFIRL